MPGLSPFRYTIPADGRVRVPTRGTTIFLYSSDGTIRVRAINTKPGMDGETYTLDMNPAEEWKTATEFTRLEITDRSGAQNEIVLYVGYGSFHKPVPDEVTVNFDVAQDVNVVSSQPSPAPSTTLDTIADVTVEDTVVQILPANANRVRALISAPSGNANTLRIGDTDVSNGTRGQPLAPGETLPIDSTASIHGVGVAASGDVVTVLELNL